MRGTAAPAGPAAVAAFPFSGDRLPADRLELASGRYWDSRGCVSCITGHIRSSKVDRPACPAHLLDTPSAVIVPARDVLLSQCGHYPVPAKLLNKWFYLGKLETVVCPTAHDCCVAPGQRADTDRSPGWWTIRMHYEILRREAVRPLSVVEKRLFPRGETRSEIRPYRLGPDGALSCRGDAALPGGPRSHRSLGGDCVRGRRRPSFAVGRGCRAVIAVIAGPRPIASW